MLWTVNINVGDYGPVRLLAAGGIGGVRPRAQAQAQAMRAESCLCGRVMAGGCQLLCSPGSLQPLGGSLPCPRVQALRLELPCVAPRSCGFLYTRLWWEKGQNGAPSLGWCGGAGGGVCGCGLTSTFQDTPRNHLVFFFFCFSFLLVPLFPPRHPFLHFRRSHDLSEARVAGACSWWSSLSYTPIHHPYHTPPHLTMVSWRGSRDQGQLTPDTRGSLSGPA